MISRSCITPILEVLTPHQQSFSILVFALITIFIFYLAFDSGLFPLSTCGHDRFISSLKSLNSLFWSHWTLNQTYALTVPDFQIPCIRPETFRLFARSMLTMTKTKTSAGFKDPER